jgi:hypothetical protein
MKWPWSRSVAAPDPGPLEGAQAREQAERDLERVMDARRATEAETPIYRALGDALRELRLENHLAQSIRESMRPR